MDYDPKPAGKVRLILTRPDGTEFLVSGDKADVVDGAVVVKVEPGVDVVYPMHAFSKVEIDRK